ncbi:FAD-dependent oxidoreductase [Paraburkholderia fungorum]
MQATKRALVVGGGIGGLSAAIALRKAGVAVDVVEITEKWTVYHVGIIVQANVIRAMKELGIADECIAAGCVYDGVSFRNAFTDEEIAHLHTEPLAGPSYPTDLGLTRPAFHKVLSDATLAAGAKVRLGITLADYSEHDSGVTVQFTDGTSGEYDFIIGADGLFSKLRTRLFGDKYRPEFSGQGCWRYNLPRDARVNNAIMYAGVDGGKAGFVPLTQDTMYILLVMEEPGNPRLPAEQLHELYRQRLTPFKGLVEELKDKITDPGLVVYRPLETVFVTEPWHKGRVLLIGDAVHATTPHLGQGAAQAIEDGVVLGQLVNEGLALDALFSRFMERRYARCKFIYDSSLQIGAWEQQASKDADPVALTAKMLEVVAAPI